MSENQYGEYVIDSSGEAQAVSKDLTDTISFLQEMMSGENNITQDLSLSSQGRDGLKLLLIELYFKSNALYRFFDKPSEPREL